MSTALWLLFAVSAVSSLVAAVSACIAYRAWKRQR